MTTKRILARPDFVFGLVGSLFAAVVFQSSALDDVCQGVFRFKSLPAFSAMPVAIWMRLGVLTGIVIPAIAAWAFRRCPEIVVPALAQVVLLLVQIAIEAVFALSGETRKIALVGAAFSTWRAIRLLQLSIETGQASSTWRIVFFACALQWTINLSFLVIVLRKNCIA